MEKDNAQIGQGGLGHAGGDAGDARPDAVEPARDEGKKQAMGESPVRAAGARPQADIRIDGGINGRLLHFMLTIIQHGVRAGHAHLEHLATSGRHLNSQAMLHIAEHRTIPPSPLAAAGARDMLAAIDAVDMLIEQMQSILPANAFDALPVREGGVRYDRVIRRPQAPLLGETVLANINGEVLVAQLAEDLCAGEYLAVAGNSINQPDFKVEAAGVCRLNDSQIFQIIRITPPTRRKTDAKQRTNQHPAPRSAANPARDRR